MRHETAAIRASPDRQEQILLSLDPPAVPVRIALDPFDQSFAQRVGDDVARLAMQILCAADAVIVEAGLPHRITHPAQLVDGTRRARFERLHMAAQRAFAQFEEPMDVAWHDDPCVWHDEACTVQAFDFSDCGSRALRIGEQWRAARTDDRHGVVGAWFGMAATKEFRIGHAAWFSIPGQQGIGHARQIASENAVAVVDPSLLGLLSLQRARGSEQARIYKGQRPLGRLAQTVPWLPACRRWRGSRSGCRGFPRVAASAARAGSVPSRCRAGRAGIRWRRR